MTQLTVPDNLVRGMYGQKADSGFDDIATYINNSKQLFRVTITAIDLSTTVTINGTAFNVNAGSAAKTKAELVDLLVAAINAGAEPVLAIDDGDFMNVEADVVGTAFTCVGTLNCTVAEQIPNEAGINFGLCVVQDKGAIAAGGDDNLAHLPTLVTQVTDVGTVLGVTVHTQAIEQAVLNANNVGYPIASAMSVMRKGRIWVYVEDAVVVGAQAFVRCVAGAGEYVGAFRSDVDGSDAGALPSSRFKLTAGAGELTILEINLPTT